MNRSMQSSFIAIPVVLALLVSAMMVSPAYAGDETPPPTDTPAEVTPTVSDTTPAEGAAPAVTDSALLGQVPEGTDVVVTDDSGEVIPLASEEAAAIMADSDPLWCPAGHAPTPGTGGCSASYVSISALVGAFVPTGNGTIWVLHGGATSSALINGSAGWAPAKNFSLTVQGGWNGTSGSSALDPLDPTSTFADYLYIWNWVGPVTIKNVNFVSATYNTLYDFEALDVFTHGNITLDKVVVRSTLNSDVTFVGNGAFLDNTLGTGTVLVTNSTFGSNEGLGLSVNSTKTITLKNVIANNNGDAGATLNNTFPANAQAVNVSNSSFTGNATRGLNVASNGVITLTNINATYNGGDGAHLDNDNLGTVAAAVKVTGANNFTDNAGYGLYVISNGAISVNNTNANYNGGKGIYLKNSFVPLALAPQNVTITGFLTATYNGSFGMDIESDGSVTATNLTASFNGADGVYISNTSGALALHKPVTLSGTNWFDSNTGAGLWIYSHGAITLNNISAFYNYGLFGGVYLRNDYDAPKPQNVTFKGPATFQGNEYTGLSVFTYGAVSMNNVTASDNGWAVGPYDGVHITNDGGTLIKTVTIGGYNAFNHNNNYGLQIDFLGVVTVNNVTAGYNGNEGLNIDNLNGAVNAAAVNIKGTNAFTSNGDDGLDVFSHGNITVSNVTAYYNAVDGVYLENDFGTFQSKVTLTGFGVFAWNGTSGVGSGLHIYSRGAIAAKNLTALLNHDNGADLYTKGLAGKGPQSVTLTGTNTFNNNGVGGSGSGLVVNTDGNITVSNLSASINQAAGADLDNFNNWDTGTFATFGSVTVTGFGYFTGNVTGDGLDVFTHGKATLNHIIADANGNSIADQGIQVSADGNVTLVCSAASYNDGAGLYVHNNASGTGPVPLLTLKGFIGGGNSGGLVDTYWIALVSTACP